MLFKRVQKTIGRYHLLGGGDRVVLGVSGGVDSMVLLHLLYNLREEFSLSLIVAHVNHGLRPNESKKEAELVERESNRLGLPFEYGQFDVKKFSQTAGLSVQDAARRIRFHFFETLLLKYEARKIALGHNADDQVETILLRLFRGSGLKGLKGMLPIREMRVIRPLLEVWRREIEFFAIESKIPYLLDSSNLRGDYLRNRIRLNLIPLIEKEYQPSFKELVFKTSAFLREEDDYLEREAEEAYHRLIPEERVALSFNFSDFQSLHKAIQWRVIQRMLERVYRKETEGNEAWIAIDPVYERLRHPPSSFVEELPHGVCLEKRYDRVKLKKSMVKLIPPFEVELLTPGPTLIKEIEREVWVEELDGKARQEDLPQSSEIAFLDYQKLRFPLRMRNFRPGDRFQPLGVRGQQKLKEFFIDHKIPRFERPEVSLLISGEKVAWVVGYRISDQVKVDEETKKILRVEVRRC
ncbi:MAG: tRNA lysidine(34) synthetase TilS [Deltaproteobacteria bacterium RBG_16_48_10]|nr:MAG: tRNA lysidine(34) synthetase TilS [Deltaproteobacteria bacterium RBG_16_48_10]